MKLIDDWGYKLNFLRALNKLDANLRKNIVSFLSKSIQDKECLDSWVNEVASIKSNNSLSQYNKFLIKKLDYRECAMLSLDTLINKSIIALSYDIISHGYNIEIEHSNKDYATDIKDRILKRINHFCLNEKIQDLVMSSFRFGGAFLYFDINQKFDIPISNTYECASINNLDSFKIIEPYSVTPSEVDNSNSLSKNYMNPSKWYVNGAGSIDNSRLLKLVLFEVPDVIKPLFNYLGISLTQLMVGYTQNAEIIRDALSELMLRFKTDYIKTNSENIASEEYLARIKYNNQTRNNFSTLLLSEDEDLQSLSTSIAGVDNIISQAYELVVASSGIPATRLLGISPRGFNATGESDLIHYYELISQYQSKIKPILIECIKKILFFDLKIFDVENIDISFNPIGYKTEKEQVETYNLMADFFTKLTQNGILSESEALKCLQDNDFNLNQIKSENEYE